MACDTTLVEKPVYFAVRRCLAGRPGAGLRGWRPLPAGGQPRGGRRPALRPAPSGRGWAPVAAAPAELGALPGPVEAAQVSRKPYVLSSAARFRRVSGPSVLKRPGGICGR